MPEDNVDRLRGGNKASRTLSELLRSGDKILNDFLADVGVDITRCGPDDQQQYINIVNRYLAFELVQNKDLIGRKIAVTGFGLLLLSTPEGELQGVEVLSDGDVVVGEVSDLSALPIPTTASLYRQGALMCPGVEESVSLLVVLQSGVYKTGLMRDGHYEVEHDLSTYQLAVSTAHPLSLSVV